MASADKYSAPGAAQYDSNTMTVGDGTWDFDKNTFLLPNLAGVDFETMRYNGMGNRFSTVPEYHSLILARGIIGAIVFLGLIPAAVMTARFYVGRPGFARRYHAMIHIFAVLLLTVVFILGWFAVGPNRSWTNPHHAIGLAVYVMFLLQLIGGRIVRHLGFPSLRLMIHQWSGRLIALLGLIQVPLGLTLYGSPKYLFILFSVWTALLLLLYFILDFRASKYKHHDSYGGGHSNYGPPSEYHTEHTVVKKEGGGWKRWLAPLAGLGAIWALFGRRKNKDRTNVRSRSNSVSSVNGPVFRPSRRGSASYVHEEKYTEVESGREKKRGGGFMNGLLAAGAALGAGKLVSGLMNKRENNKYAEEYSAVSTETPRRDRIGRQTTVVSDYSDYTVDTRHNPGTASILPPPGDPTATTMTAQALSAAEERGGRRPITPRPSHARTRPGYSVIESDYSSYVSPSRRPEDLQGGGGRGGPGKGIFAGIGLGWLGKKWADRKNRREEERRFRDEEDQRSGMLSSRYTGDGYSSPSPRRHQRRPSGRQPAASTVATSVTNMTEDSSYLEPRPATSGFSGPPMPPLAGNLSSGTNVPLAAAPPVPPGYSLSVSHSRHDVLQPVDMPSMPPDPQGILHRESESEGYFSPTRRDSSRRRRGERAMAVAAASASALAAQEEARRSRLTSAVGSGSPGAPVSVKVKVHDDKDRNVTLRRLTEEEAAASRREQRRRRNDSFSSISGTDRSPSRRRYRRDASQRRDERAAESAVSGSVMTAAPPPAAPSQPLPPLSPPNPAFAAGRKPKDSAYYSGQPAQPSLSPAPMLRPEASSVGSPESHGTWSAMSPSPSAAPAGSTAAGSAADNRRRRRQERRTASRPTGTDMFD